jgi:hypothetical protein
MKWLTQCSNVPEGTWRSFYHGPHLYAALKCLRAGYEDNAASWMWRDKAENGSSFHPVAGTLREVVLDGMTCIEYCDVQDVSEELTGVAGDGI